MSIGIVQILTSREVRGTELQRADFYRRLRSPKRWLKDQVPHLLLSAGSEVPILGIPLDWWLRIREVDQATPRDARPSDTAGWYDTMLDCLMESLGKQLVLIPLWYCAYLCWSW